MLNLKHKKLDVWILSIELVKSIYKVTAIFPNEEKYGLISQLRRASVSVSSNISEGCSKKSIAERHRYYEMARSSLIEIDTQIEIAFDLGYLDRDQKELEELINHIFAKLTNLMNHT